MKQKNDRSSEDLSEELCFHNETEAKNEQTPPEPSPYGYEIDRELEAEFDSAPKRQKAKKGLGAFLSVRGLLILGCLVTFAVCTVILVGRFIDYRRTDDIYKTLADEMFKEVSGEPSILSTAQKQIPEAALNDYATTLTLGVSVGDISENTAAVGDIHFARIKAKLEQIRAVNEDILGWIRIEGTEINYPFVVGEDNDYYLTHAYNGEYLRSGTIFADYRNSSTSISDNKNTVLYGHNMANGAMFAVINTYKRNPELFDRLIYIYSFDGVYVYEPYALLETVASFYYFQTDFSNGDEFEAYLSRMQEVAVMKKDIELSARDKIISLSTCSGHSVTGRRCLQAKLIRIDHAG